jgi:hypothetical protein
VFRKVGDIAMSVECFVFVEVGSLDGFKRSGVGMFEKLDGRFLAQVTLVFDTQEARFFEFKIIQNNHPLSSIGNNEALVTEYNLDLHFHLGTTPPWPPPHCNTQLLTQYWAKLGHF